MDKIKKQLLAVLVIFAVLFTAVAFLIPFPKGGTFWIAYIAEIISFALQVPFFKTAFDGKEELKSKVLGFPIFRVGYIYLGTQTALSLAFFALGFAPGFPVWLTAVVCLIVLAGGLVCGISADIAHEEVTKMETVMKPDTGFMKSLCTKSAPLVNQTEDVNLKKALESLAENIRFSDPVSSPAIAEQERTLEQSFEKLSQCISDTVSATEQCKIVMKNLEERNEFCKNNK